jgi:hypothetical protein
MNREMDDNSLYLIGGGLVAILVAVGMLLTNKGSGASTSGAGTGSVQKEVPYPGGKMSIYFGSQTGTAEGFARTLMEEGRERGFDAQTYDLEDFEPEQVSNSRRSASCSASSALALPYRPSALPPHHSYILTSSTLCTTTLLAAGSLPKRHLPNGHVRRGRAHR